MGSQIYFRYMRGRIEGHYAVGRPVGWIKDEGGIHQITSEQFVSQRVKTIIFVFLVISVSLCEDLLIRQGEI